MFDTKLTGSTERIQLGQEARDKITGFKGIIIGRADYLFGCAQYALTPKTNEAGEVKDTQWFDEGRIEVIGQGVAPEEVRVERNGGPNRDAPRL